MPRQKEKDFPAGQVVKNLPFNAGDVGLIPGQGNKESPCAATKESPRNSNEDPEQPKKEKISHANSFKIYHHPFPYFSAHTQSQRS